MAQTEMRPGVRDRNFLTIDWLNTDLGSRRQQQGRHQLLASLERDLVFAAEHFPFCWRRGLGKSAAYVPVQ